MSEPLLRVRDLSVRLPGSKRAICDGVSFSLAAGERVALFGPSGAGKTTLLRAINSSVPVHAGQIAFAGEAANPVGKIALRNLRRRIAMIPQKHDLVESLRVYHNVMAGALGRWSDAHALRFLFWPSAAELQEAKAALKRVGLDDKLNARSSALSGGQQQRVAIARALVQQPLLILADEPVASLDPRMAHQVLELLCGLAKHDGVALVCTLHQPELARQYFPRLLQMEAGRLIADCASVPQPMSRPQARPAPEELIGERIATPEHANERLA
jgi:phosphonate transport system ATP-binding protein